MLNIRSRCIFHMCSGWQPSSSSSSMEDLSHCCYSGYIATSKYPPGVQVGPEEIMDFRVICLIVRAIAVYNRTTQKVWDTDRGIHGTQVWDTVGCTEERFGMHTN